MQRTDTVGQSPTHYVLWSQALSLAAELDEAITWSTPVDTILRAAPVYARLITGTYTDGDIRQAHCILCEIELSGAKFTNN